VLPFEMALHVSMLDRYTTQITRLRFTSNHVGRSLLKLSPSVTGLRKTRCLAGRGRVMLPRRSRFVKEAELSARAICHHMCNSQQTQVSQWRE
jgi:hypothetical protein